jgi:hypothetical protein
MAGSEGWNQTARLKKAASDTRLTATTLPDRCWNARWNIGP